MTQSRMPSCQGGFLYHQGNLVYLWECEQLMILIHLNSWSSWEFHESIHAEEDVGTLACQFLDRHEMELGIRDVEHIFEGEEALMSINVFERELYTSSALCFHTCWSLGGVG